MDQDWAFPRIKLLSPIARALAFSSAKIAVCIMERRKLIFRRNECMAMLSTIFYAFLSMCAMVGCIRAAKLVIKSINSLFDKIEDKLG